MADNATSGSAESLPKPTSFRDLSPVDRKVVLREAAISAELATGHQEKTVEQARRNVFLRIGTIIRAHV